MQKIIWTIIILLFGLGLIPYKFPKDPDKRSDKELLVDHEESTCTTDFAIFKGTLDIPPDLKSYFPNKPTDITLAEGISPFDPIDKQQINWFLITENDFIISGKVIGVDSTDKKYCGNNYPIFKIDNWSPTNYFANFWSFSFPVFLIYFAVIIIGVLTSIILFFVGRHRKNKT